MKRHLQTLAAALLVCGFALAQYPNRGRFAAPGTSTADIIAATGWTLSSGTTSTTSNISVLNPTTGAGGTRTAQFGSNTAGHVGVTIQSYADPGSVNAMEFRFPGSSTLHGYFYPDQTKGALITGKIQSESALVKGSKVLAAGTGTVTVLSGSKCTCTNETTALAVTCPVATTTLTITSGVGTDTVSYICL